MRRMKKIVVLVSFICLQKMLYSQEGMWVPMFLEKNETQMQKQGFHLNAEDVYSTDSISMKDGVVLFGGGCTGVIISNEGLVLTNHHCGYGTISRLSTLEHNYLKNGYWALNKSEELPAAGLSVTLLIKMEDITDKILPFLSDTLNEIERNKKVKELSNPIVEEAIKGTHYGASVKSMYYGNQYYLFITETFKDIRLVAAPPEVVGNFGGETDNWVWPRQSGDFSVFRIYADKNNAPVEYHEDNIPYNPKYFFPISLNGVQENDFTLVFGYPGRTQEYLPSYAIDLIMHSTNPNRILCRDIRLETMNKFMAGNDTITLNYANKARGISNANKKWKGEILGLTVNHAIEKKQTFEKQFQTWADDSQRQFDTLLPAFEKLYADFKPYSEMVDFTSEAFYGIEIFSFASSLNSFVKSVENINSTDSSIHAEAKSASIRAKNFFSTYQREIDKQVFIKLMRIYAEHSDPALQSVRFKEQAKKYNGNYEKWWNDLNKKSLLLNEEKLQDYFSHFNKSDLSEFLSDPIFMLHKSVYDLYSKQISEIVEPYQLQISVLMRSYMQAQMMMQPDKSFYPDANSTLRVAFGNVKGIHIADGVQYDYYTTDNGIERKYKEGDEEFDVPEDLLHLFQENNFGKYADKNGALPIGFLATNHTTGGNSGSPVINADGELIGLNFDRIWEGTMSDIMYDINRCRNISIDIRYVLFMLDRYANAQYLMNEIKIAD